MTKVLAVALLAIAAFCCATAAVAPSPTTQPATRPATQPTTQTSYQSWTFVSFSDFVHRDYLYPSAVDEEYFDNFLKIVKSSNPDFVLCAGDICDGHWGSKTNPENAIRAKASTYFGAWRARIAAYGLTCYNAVGDHDVGDVASQTGQLAGNFPSYHKAYADFMGQPLNGPAHLKGTAYYVKHKNVLIVAIDPFDQDEAGKWSHDGPLSRQMQWFEQTLAQFKDSVDFVFVIGHFPILGSPKCHSSGIRITGYEKSAIWNSLAKNKVDVYASGEKHVYDHKFQDGVHHFVHGGREVCPMSYLVCTVEGKVMRIQAKSLSMAGTVQPPTLIDTIVIDKR